MTADMAARREEWPANDATISSRAPPPTLTLIVAAHQSVSNTAIFARPLYLRMIPVPIPLQ